MYVIQLIVTEDIANIVAEYQGKCQDLEQEVQVKQHVCTPGSVARMLTCMPHAGIPTRNTHAHSAMHITQHTLLHVYTHTHTHFKKISLSPCMSVTVK